MRRTEVVFQLVRIKMGRGTGHDDDEDRTQRIDGWMERQSKAFANPLLGTASAVSMCALVHIHIHKHNQLLY